jgi:hypothetical protein
MKSKTRRLAILCMFVFSIIFIAGCSVDYESIVNRYKEKGTLPDSDCTRQLFNAIKNGNLPDDVKGYFDDGKLRMYNDDCCGCLYECNKFDGKYEWRYIEPNKDEVFKEKYENDEQVSPRPCYSDEKVDYEKCELHDSIDKATSELKGACYFNEEAFDWENEEHVNLFNAFPLQYTYLRVDGTTEKLRLYDILIIPENLKQVDLSYLSEELVNVIVDTETEWINEGVTIKLTGLFDMETLYGDLEKCFIYRSELADDASLGDVLICREGEEHELVIVNLKKYSSTHLGIFAEGLVDNAGGIVLGGGQIYGNFNYVSKLDDKHYDLGFPGYEQVVGTLGFIQDGAVLITFQDEEGYETLTLSNKGLSPKGQAYFLVNNPKCLDIDPKGLFLSTKKDLQDEIDTSKLMENIQKLREESQEESQEEDLFDSISESVNQDNSEIEESEATEEETEQETENSGEDTEDEQLEEDKWVLCTSSFVDYKYCLCEKGGECTNNEAPYIHDADHPGGEKRIFATKDDCISFGNERCKNWI